jgi:TfoX/Sxy family transcriptional regulator of competence genes
MAYDEALADRIRDVLRGEDRLTERKMFGGIAFIVGGNMAVGVIGDDLMVRVGADAHDEAVAQPHARPMDFTNRPTRGMVYVDTDGTRADADLARWVRTGAAFATSLPPK